MTIKDFIDTATRILFFTGKGGVGKTSLSCATGLALAARGKRVLLISTDPASNLDEILESRFTDRPAPVPGADGLFALNIDPESAAAAYRERIVGPCRGVLPPATVASMEEQLSGACTVEIAAFNQFANLLGERGATADFDHVIFDTAPTGHTIRLLSLPAAWTGFIAANTTGTSCLGPLAGLEAQKDLYAASLRTLADEETTTLVLVSRPEATALAEAERTRNELAGIGMRRQILIVNGLFAARGKTDIAAAALEARGQQALSSMPRGLSTLPRVEIPLRGVAPMGVQRLSALFSEESATLPAAPKTISRRWPALGPLIEEIISGGPGVILTMGKGGVGKTTIAAAIAVTLADRGLSVHLSTTDPAAHLSTTVNGVVPGLRISRIDPAAETARYTAAVLSGARGELDAQGFALLEEDLRSPCTEEIAVFRAFADIVAARDSEFVVLDTAPTGHTLLLLDAAEAYHREVTRKLSDVPDSVRDLLPRLRDSRFTRVIIVTVPEATPVHEAARLQADLGRAEIPTYAWVVNQSFAAAASEDLLLRNKAELETSFIEEVETRLSARTAVLPWVPAEPVGPERLRRFAGAGNLKEPVRK
jgi:arsenite-transporting ATPase